MPTWVNFRELRARLDFEMVLRHYGIEVKRRGDQHHGYCPLPKHDGKKNSASFSANLKRGIFQCFGCGAKGNILEFAGMMEKINLEDGVAFREVALGLQQRFCPDAGSPQPKPGNIPQQSESRPGVVEKPRVINAPLDFELKGLDMEHPYLKGRGFNLETIRSFGLGFCARGLLKDRVVIPLHDQKARLVGYAGRVVDEAAISEENPRYRLPSKRERDGKMFEFRKTHFLYNGFRVQAPSDRLVIVEGFPSVWWLHQNQIPHVVATMGADCSERQAQLIISILGPNGQALIMPDGNEAGERCAASLLTQLSPHRFVRWIRLPADKQPTDFAGDELRALLPV